MPTSLTQLSRLFRLFCTPYAVLLALGGITGVVQPASAADTAILVEAGDERLREDVQWLSDRGVIDVTTSSWPMPLAMLEAAVMEGRLAKLSPVDRFALENVKRFISRQHRTTVGVKVHLNSDKIPQLGFASQSLATGTASAYFSASASGVAVKLQANSLVSAMTDRQSKWNMQGSYVAASVFGQVVYLGQLSHWWGPGQDGSLAWSNAATAIPGLGIKRATETPFRTPWLAWIGPWGYEFFLGQQQHSVAIRDTRVANMRLHVRPVRGLELGVSRMIQWGGKGKRNGLGGLWDALTSNSNVDDPSADFSNELAGFDLRYTTRLLWGNPLTVYAQAMGEDEASMRPSQYLGQVGLQFKHMVGNSRLHWHVEAADTMARRLFGSGGRPGYAYSHHMYKDGFYEDGLPIGHAIGGSGKMYSAGLTVVPDDSKYQSRYNFKVLQAEVNPRNEAINMAFRRKDRFYGAQVGVSWVMAPITFRAAATVLRSRDGDQNNAFGVMFGADIPLYIF